MRAKHGGVAQLNTDCQWSVSSLHAHPFPGTPVYTDATCFQRIRSEQMSGIFSNKLNAVQCANDIYTTGGQLLISIILHRVSDEFIFVIFDLVL